MLLKKNEYISDHYEPTLNKKGFMLKKIDPFAMKFLNDLKHNTQNIPSLDIGSAYGHVVIEALKLGHNVIANDLDKEHLDLLVERASLEGIEAVQTLAGDFFDLDIQKNSLYSIHISRVLHFLKGEDIIRALDLFKTWLIPGGKVFAINDTPFQMPPKNYFSTYLSRVEHNHPWPGLIEDLSLFDPTKTPFLTGFVHLLDNKTCIKMIEKSDIELLEIEYYDRKGYYPDDVILDGRESIGFILSA